MPEFAQLSHGRARPGPLDPPWTPHLLWNILQKVDKVDEVREGPPNRQDWGAGPVGRGGGVTACLGDCGWREGERRVSWGLGGAWRGLEGDCCEVREEEVSGGWCFHVGDWVDGCPHQGWGTGGWPAWGGWWRRLWAQQVCWRCRDHGVLMGGGSDGRGWCGHSVGVLGPLCLLCCLPTFQPISPA